MTNRDKRTLRYGAIAIVLYLVVFFGWSQVKRLEGKRQDYQKLLVEAERLKKDIKPYENRGLLIEKLRGVFNMQPAKLSRRTVVAEASAAIQKAAQGGGIQLGPLRESPGRSSAKEVSTMQLEATGQVAALMGLLHRLNTLGYPILIDSVQFNQEPAKPGMLKAHLTIIILDFEQWKAEEPAHA
jgi:hypothetical protein